MGHPQSSQKTEVTPKVLDSAVLSLWLTFNSYANYCQKWHYYIVLCSSLCLLFWPQEQVHLPHCILFFCSFQTYDMGVTSFLWGTIGTLQDNHIPIPNSDMLWLCKIFTLWSNNGEIDLRANKLFCFQAGNVLLVIRCKQKILSDLEMLLAKG